VRSEIYAKAARIVAESRIRVEDETENAVYFRIRGDTGDHLVRLSSDSRFSCTCTAASFKGPRGALCSHAIAAILDVAQSTDPHAEAAGVLAADSTADHEAQ
jgi:hypothetical protein